MEMNRTTMIYSSSMKMTVSARPALSITRPMIKKNDSLKPCLMSIIFRSKEHLSYHYNIVEDLDSDGIEDFYDKDDDNDGFPDHYEIGYGSNPRDANSTANLHLTFWI